MGGVVISVDVYGYVGMPISLQDEWTGADCPGFAVCVAKLSDIYGRKNMIVGSWVIFVAFSMACALPKTMLQL
jgi:MFS family permease